MLDKVVAYRISNGKINNLKEYNFQIGNVWNVEMY